MYLTVSVLSIIHSFIHSLIHTLGQAHWSAFNKVIPKWFQKIASNKILKDFGHHKRLATLIISFMVWIHMVQHDIHLPVVAIQHLKPTQSKLKGFVLSEMPSLNQEMH